MRADSRYLTFQCAIGIIGALGVSCGVWLASHLPKLIGAFTLLIQTHLR